MSLASPRRFPATASTVTLAASFALGSIALLTMPRTARAQEVPVVLPRAPRVGPHKTFDELTPAQRARIGAQIAALSRAKRNLTPAQRKMDSALVFAAKQARGEETARGVARLRTPAVRDMAGRVLVDIRVVTANPQTLADIRAVGGKIVYASETTRSVRAWVPAAQTETLAALPSIVRVSVGALPQTRTGSVTSEGDKTHRADAARATYGVTGAGVKVGVISDSADFLAASQASGDLPASVTVLAGQGGTGEGEGTAMMEIVHDIAPGAPLYFATGGVSPSGMADNIRALKAAGCAIIVDDIGWFDQSPFGDDIIAQAINEVTAGGALYFSASGNDGNLADGTATVWEGNFKSSGVDLTGEGGLAHAWSGNDALNQLSSDFDDAVVYLFWSDPLNDSVADYDLYAFNPNTFEVVAASQAMSGPGVPPLESIAAPPGSNIVVYKASGDARFLHLNAHGVPLNYATTGQVYGHAAAEKAVSVSAAPAHVSIGIGNSPTGPFPGPFTTAQQSEIFADDGPRRIFYNPNGTAITPGNLLASGGRLLLKPDITAADGVVTSAAFGPNSGLNPFFGTSAAAPHAAAITALVKSRNPSLTNEQLRALITNPANLVDIEGAGWGAATGYGILMADKAVGSAIGPSQWQPVDVAISRTDNTSRLLWKETTNRYAVWKLASNGAIQVGKYYGPISGYTCEQIVVAPNGQATLFWKNPTTKQAALWTLAADLSAIVKATVYNYPAGYTPQNIAADQGSAIRMSWRKTANNAIALWTITPGTGLISGSAVYGPYANLQDGPIAVGADGRIRLLWRNTSTGGATLWTIPANYGAPSAGYNYSPVAGATPADIAVGTDNKTRLQWRYTDGKIALWKLNTVVGGTGAIESGKFYGPTAGVSPLGLTVGGDNQTRQLWKYDTGKAALWVLNDPLTTISAAYTYGPIY